MSATDTYRRQHEDLVKVVVEISGYLDPEKAKKDAAQVSALLSRLVGKLKIHLAMEDESLYPKLLAHADPKVKEIATRFQKEMGTMKPVVEGFAKKWGSAMAIQGNPAEFVKETKGLFDALGKRVEKENNELYATFDKVAG